MKTLVRVVVVLGLIAGAGVGSYRPLKQYLFIRSIPKWRTEAVSKGRIVSVVNATGTTKPVLSVQVGAFVSGPIDEVLVDFNDEVQAGQVLARIDTRLYQANVDRDTAQLRTREAEVERVEALLQQAIRNEKRSKDLQAENPDFISDTEMDQFRFNRLSLEAEKKLAEAAIAQAQASLNNSLANLKYCDIVAPVSGIIIDRKIDRGQTLASQFQTPVLFVVAPEMRKEMHIYATVDEADIGLIREAQLHEQPVRFTVDAYPDDLFEGKIQQIRMSSETNQNVVTYPVVVAAPNPDLKLLPGMTANLSFQSQQRDDVLKVSNAALRFYPDRKFVRIEDHPLLDGIEVKKNVQQDDSSTDRQSADERADAARARNRRHVWVVDGKYLRAIEVFTGISDNQYTEVESGDLKEGQELVTGIQPKKP